MSRLAYHEKKDSVKWWIVGIVIVLVMAAVAWLIVAAVKDINPLCLFKHNYGDDGKCIRCGADKPVEESVRQPRSQTVFSESNKIFFSTGTDDQAMTNAILPGFRQLQPGDVITSTSELLIDVSDFNGSQSEFVPYLLYETEQGSLYFAVGDFLTSGKWTSYYCFVTSIPAEWGNEQLSDPWDYADAELTLEIMNVPLSRLGTVTAVDSSKVYISFSELPSDPVKIGYTFTGWYTDEACTELYTADTVTGDITLYAGFRPHSYSVKFNANGGNGEMANEAVTYDQSKALSKCTFTKEHYAFAGWSTSENGSVVFSDQEIIKNLSSEDNAVIELYAVWQRSEIAVDFDVEGNVTTSWITIGSSATLPEAPYKEGHLFVGWFMSDGTEYISQPLSEDTTLTARFSIIRCTVTFILDGEIYAVYVCDWGTSLAQALNGAKVNTVLYKADEHSANFQ